MIPIFVDPIGLSESEKTMSSSIAPIDLDQVALPHEPAALPEAARS